ncbi:MAG TPA: hypothetical protein VGX78_06600, partial [Pirellulales bacterium]|nr:hypothetical protein [Pirellulales bacterium]
MTLNAPAQGPILLPRRQLGWGFVLIVHALGAAGWWWLMPGGFPPENPHFWINQVLPYAIGAPAVCGLWGQWKRRARFQLAIFLAVPAFWTGVALFGAVLFPTSSMRALPIVGIGAALLWRDWIVAARRAGALPSTTAGVAAAGVVIGVAAAWSQRGADPDTHPRNDAAPSLAGDDPGLPTGLIPLGDDGAIQTTDGAVSWRRG